MVIFIDSDERSISTMVREARETPKGFLFSTGEAAIKKPGRKDLALIFSENDAIMSGMFTINRVKAAPVRLDRERIKAGEGRAIIVNSGNANACTGEQGMKDAVEMTEVVAASLGIRSRKVYVCSTGVIGTALPMDRIRQRIPDLVAGLGKGTIDDVAAAIMTTDTFPKVVSKRVKIGHKTVTVTGVCKGAGMICPTMATMLCFIMTDVRITKSALHGALHGAVKGSFNRITVDGDMSTNDTVLMMANGAAGNDPVREGSRSLRLFSSTLSFITRELSRLIVQDGEGATKVVSVMVKNARTPKEAEKAASAIANSVLVKTALHGNDANWGRIMAALGYSGIAVRDDQTDISFDNVKMAHNGLSTGRDREAAEVLKKKEVRITVDLHLGTSSAEVLTCDLTEDYVRINAEYRT